MDVQEDHDFQEEDMAQLSALTLTVDEACLVIAVQG